MSRSNYARTSETSGTFRHDISVEVVAEIYKSGITAYLIDLFVYFITGEGSVQMHKIQMCEAAYGSAVSNLQIFGFEDPS